jgi:adenine-specific DNA-methyltransferase
MRQGRLARASLRAGDPVVAEKRTDLSSSLALPVRLVQRRFADQNSDKLRGGYYTPEELATWLCSWAVRSPQDRVLEPSCGSGNFVIPAARRLLALGASKAQIKEQLTAVELISEEANVTRKRLEEFVEGASRRIVHAEDFFAWRARFDHRFDAVIGNPPFIRYQNFPEPARTRAMALMSDLGLRPNKLTNIWVPFVLAAVEALVPGGRLAMVIPAELLQVSYAAQLRLFLVERFCHVEIISCNELIFENAEQEVVLLLASGARSDANIRCRVAAIDVGSISDLVRCDPVDLINDAEEKDVVNDSEKWTKYFLSNYQVGLMRALRSNPLISPLGRHASVDVGVVTGKNEFFVRRISELRANKIDSYTHALVSRSAHLKGALLREDEWESLSEADERVHLVNIRNAPGKKLNRYQRAYIHEGEEKGFHLGYKCKIRSPWYHVPSIFAPGAFLFRQIYDFPRMVANHAGATATDTIHRVTTLSCSVDDLVSSTYSSLTAASSEIEGRSYGGGVLELEPTEAERLLVPAKLGKGLSIDDIDRFIRAGKLIQVLDESDRKLLRGEIGLSKKECGEVRDIWIKLRDRRRSRTKRRQTRD